MDLLTSPSALMSHIIEALHQDCTSPSIWEQENGCSATSSSVMLLLGEQPVEMLGHNTHESHDAPESRKGHVSHERREPAGHRQTEISIILNKRSRKVRQAGDLCCPGGTVEPHLDPYLARLLLLPGSPLARWPYWTEFRHRSCRASARLLALMVATGLRESWEEMRLNPMSVMLLGLLPPQRLLMFYRIIHPVVGWVKWQQKFVPSWEVEKIVKIPLRSLLNPAHYACYRLYIPPHLEKRLNHHSHTQDMPCFLYQDGTQTEMLWGATYRIVMDFMRRVFHFEPPNMNSLPLIPGILDEGYIHGRED